MNRYRLIFVFCNFFLLLIDLKAQIDEDYLNRKFDSCQQCVEKNLNDSTLKALLCSQLELEISNILKDKEKTMIAYYDLGQSFYFLNQSKKSLEYFYKGLKLSTQLNDFNNKALFEFECGKLYLYLNKPDIALEYLNKALKYHMLNNNKPQEIAILGNIAIGYGQNFHYIKSEETLEKILKYYEDENDKINIITTKINMVVLLDKMKESAKALYILNSLSNYDKLNIPTKIQENILLLKGQLYNQKGDFERAINEFEIVIELSGISKDYKLEEIATSTLASIFYKANEFERASVLYKRNSELKDSILSIDGQKRLQELEIIYRVAQNEKEIENLQVIKSLNIQKMWLLSILVILLIVIYIFVFLSLNNSCV